MHSTRAQVDRLKETIDFLEQRVWMLEECVIAMAAVHATLGSMPVAQEINIIMDKYTSALDKLMEGKDGVS